MLVYFLLSYACLHEVSKVQAFVLELNTNCIRTLETINDKHKNLKIELEHIKWLCKIRSEKYNAAVSEFKEVLAEDLLKATGMGCLP
jgi:hypothetical protein